MLQFCCDGTGPRGGFDVADTSPVAPERPAVATRERRNGRIAALLATTALVSVTTFAPDAARAQNATWTGATGNFNLGINWDTNTVPTGTAFFGASGTTA